MTHEERQAELLDAYLDALQQNPDAAIPDGLEPEMADFARMFMVDDAIAAQTRVWEQIESATEDLPVSTEKRKYQEMESHMRKKYEKNKGIRKRGGWLPMAAAAILTVTIGGALIGMYFKSNGKILDPAVNPSTVMTATALVDDFLATQEMSNTMQPTVPPPFVVTATPIPAGSDPFLMTATQLIVNATEMAMPDDFDLRATQLIIDATQTAMPLQFTSTPIASPIAATSQNVTLVCDFERDLLLRLNSNQIGINDQLIVSGLARTPGTVRLSIEIFGGFLTNDTYVPIIEYNNPPTSEIELARITGSAYPQGSYLLQLRLSDASGETLSSCALPVTFTGN